MDLNQHSVTAFSVVSNTSKNMCCRSHKSGMEYFSFISSGENLYQRTFGFKSEISMLSSDELLTDLSG